MNDGSEGRTQREQHGRVAEVKDGGVEVFNGWAKRGKERGKVEEEGERLRKGKREGRVIRERNNLSLRALWRGSQPSLPAPPPSHNAAPPDTGPASRPQGGGGGECTYRGRVVFVSQNFKRIFVFLTCERYRK